MRSETSEGNRNADTSDTDHPGPQPCWHLYGGYRILPTGLHRNEDLRGWNTESLVPPLFPVPHLHLPAFKGFHARSPVKGDRKPEVQGDHSFVWEKLPELLGGASTPVSASQ